MLKILGAIFRYSLLVLTILVLSHIIEIKGVTLSQHVLNAMRSIGGFSPTHEIEKKFGQYNEVMKKRFETMEKTSSPEANPEVSRDDQTALNHVIEESQRKR